MIIGITGHMQAGKDTVARMLQYQFAMYKYKNLDDPKLWYTYRDLILSQKFSEDYNSRWDWKIKSFATKLKQIACVLFNCDISDFESNDFKNSELPVEWASAAGLMTYRQFLQYVGTQLFRNQFHPDVWIISALSEYKATDNWLISDVRFVNEAKAVRRYAGDPGEALIIKIERPGYDGDEHISEKEIDLIEPDILINNDETLKELWDKCLKLTKQIATKYDIS